MTTAAEADAEPTALFRGEALEHHARPQDLGELLRFPRVWTRFSYWACAALALLAAGYLALVRLDSYAAVAAVADTTLTDPGRCLGPAAVGSAAAATVLLLPASLRGRVQPGALVWLEISGLDQAPVRQRVHTVGTRLLDGGAAQACLGGRGSPGGPAPLLLALAIPDPSGVTTAGGAQEVSGLAATARIRLETQPLWRLLVGGPGEDAAAEGGEVTP